MLYLRKPTCVSPGEVIQQCCMLQPKHNIVIDGSFNYILKHKQYILQNNVHELPACSLHV